ncbi:PREDICTED: non-specific lipid-transfer protein AP10-like [Lupinus angustifolius]|uniref:non-specific lipid-transfer protein AP10-like n=1 Tax=Lupinus angustifolius TaxID=3871 RepID=UPI00092E277D|nr:PREDICTED: non-specific lipid-transfer protein AP10-like [Lupinus angustifolius]XP_019430988.1 PREDICTED: non-specific lipid-transfer protein AP10-like [Lupinus angustifolius]XP_019435328.1 PREDICTED: non-specific lipid-transfer protein AP10-like [Lupinus angustifolius]XP_019435329.1 PREDICTED: non-specific lipid-transfer protein AP10-like [Lupinus angustifolius]
MHLMCNLNFIHSEIKRSIDIEKMTMEKTVATLFLSMMILSSLYETLKASEINDITCVDAERLLLPCIPYLQGFGSPKPSSSCCSAAKTIFKGATTTKNRRALCECFKQAAPVIGVNPDRSKQLPKLCNIRLSFPLDPKINCNSIPF